MSFQTAVGYYVYQLKTNETWGAVNSMPGAAVGYPIRQTYGVYSPGGGATQDITYTARTRPITFDIIYDENGGIGKTDTKAEFLDYTGTYDQMWYLEPVEGKKGVYYPIARGTFSGEKITLHPQDDYVDGVSTLYSNKLKGDEFQQWFFDGPK